jgi:hypothetical protein
MEANAVKLGSIIDPEQQFLLINVNNDGKYMLFNMTEHEYFCDHDLSLHDWQQYLEYEKTIEDSLCATCNKSHPQLIGHQITQRNNNRVFQLLVEFGISFPNGQAVIPTPTTFDTFAIVQSIVNNPFSREAFEKLFNNYFLDYYKVEDYWREFKKSFQEAIPITDTNINDIFFDNYVFKRKYYEMYTRPLELLSVISLIDYGEDDTHIVIEWAMQSYVFSYNKRLYNLSDEKIENKYGKDEMRKQRILNRRKYMRFLMQFFKRFQQAIPENRRRFLLDQ